MKPLSMDLRQRVVAARAEGLTIAQVAERLRVSTRSVSRYCRQHQQQQGDLRPARQGGYRISRLLPHDQTIRQWVEEQSDLTIEQIQERLWQQLGVRIGYTAFWHRLDHLGLTYKKNSARRRARSA
jgi:transposase